MTRPHINVTPLIDVLLVLLIIFMVVTPMKPSSFEARVPAEPTKDITVSPDPRTIVVVVGEDESVLVNRDEIGATIDDPQKLIELLQRIFAQRELNYAAPTAENATSQIERTVFIKAPRALSYGDVAKVVDAVKAGGARPISLQIDGLE